MSSQHPPSRVRRRLRHARRLVGYGALVALILGAVLVGVANQLLPLVERNPERIAGWLSERVGQPLRFSAAYAEWTRRGPRFILSNLRVGRTGESLDVGSAELLVAVYSGLLPGSPLTELKIRDLQLQLEQGDDRRWRVLGLPTPKQPSSGDPLEVLEGFGELQIERASLRIRAPRLAIDAAIPRVDLRLRVGGDRLRGGLRAWSAAGGQPLTAVVDLRRSDWSGRLWAGVDGGELAEWADLLTTTGIRPAGRGDVDAWATVREQRVTAVQARMEVSDLTLQAISPWLDQVADGEASSPTTRFQRLRLQAAWQANERGWQVQVPQLHLQDVDGNESRYDGLWLAGGEVFALRADKVPLAPLRSLLPLSERLPEGLRRWLYRAAPEGELHDVDIIAATNGPVRGSLRLRDLSWQPSGNSPGASGLAGTASFDRDGGVVRLADSPMVFDWPVGFGEALPVRLRGTVGWWRSDGRWSFGSSGLRVVGEDYAADLRAQLQLGEPGHRPRLDLAARVDDTQFVAAKRFWVRHKMPPATVRWLDSALVQGRVVDGRAALGGDLGDWPFSNGRGRFDARASVRDATLKFSPDWPQAEQLDVDVAFDGPGFKVEGRANLAGNPIEKLVGGIAVFKQPWLELAVLSNSQGQALRQLMLDSPLNKSHGEHLKAASIEGPARVDVRMSLPLKKELGERQIDGDVDLDGASLADSRWNIRFTEVSGRTRFNQAGFVAENLKVKFEGEPARFDLAVGGALADHGLAAQANLRGTFPAAALLRQHPPLAWLQPWLSGRSAWSLALQVPRTEPGQPQAAAQLHVTSDLRGIRLGLPAPLAKDQDQVLALELHTPLPLTRGELSLRLGERMSLRGRTALNGEGMRGVIDLGPPVAGPLPESGLIVRGRAPRLDAAGWIGFANSGEGAGSLRSVEVKAEVLDLLGSDFPNVQLSLNRQGAITRVQMQGETLAGTVETGDAAGRVIGRLARMHWPENPPGSAPEPLPTAGQEQDPAAIPPLDFLVEDLRLGKTRLGRTELLTSKQARSMRVERFQSRGGRLDLDASGDWLRAEPGGITRSEFLIDFHARSLGELLGNFGMAGVIKDGPTRGRFSGRWPGSPGAFQLARFDGQFSAHVGEGQLLDVEPGGGGRFLGLISLAEIPRRLSLDFSDFFEKGFGFNTIDGDFEFANGSASTGNLRIQGPAAEIRVTGLTDLRAQTYDQRIEVLPKTGGVLPAIGALAGGPAGAAIGAMAQAVFQKPLKQAGRTVYHVTGPWKEPKVEVVERGPAPAAAATPEPALTPPAEIKPKP